MKTLKFLFLSLGILSTLNLMAQEEKKTGTKPVDEGIKSIYEESTIKNTKDINNTFEYKTKFLSKIKKYIYIKRKNINFSPFKCLIIDGNTSKVTKILIEEDKSSINFKINKSHLKAKDSILIINDKNSKENLLGKETIIQIDIAE